MTRTRIWLQQTAELLPQLNRTTVRSVGSLKRQMEEIVGGMGLTGLEKKEERKAGCVHGPRIASLSVEIENSSAFLR